MHSQRGGWLGIAVGAVLVAGSVTGAEWSDPVAGGAPVASLSSISAAASGAGRVLVAGVREEAGVPRIYLAQAEQGIWTVANGGQPAEGETRTGAVRAPVLAADPNGVALMVFARHDGVSAWRIYGRRFDGVTMSDLDDGNPANADGGTVNAYAAATASLGALHVLYTRFDGARMALHGAWWDGGAWQQSNGGLPVDAGGAGWADAPAVTGNAGGGMVAVYTQATGSGRRLFALRLGGVPLAWNWESMNGGAPLDRADLGNVSAPAVAVTADGRVLVAYLQEDGAGIPRLYALAHEGGVWVRLNGGDPVDSSPTGVGDLSVATTAAGPVLIAYTTIDAVAGVAASHLYSLEVRGAQVTPMNGGGALELAGGGLAGLDLTDGWLMFEQSAGLVRARSLATPAAINAAGGGAWQATDGLVVTGAVFRPAAGERAGLAWSVATAQDVRVTIHSIAGAPVNVLADGMMSGRVSVEWDGRDAAGRDVAPGVYVVRAAGVSFRQNAKLVVVR